MLINAFKEMNELHEKLKSFLTSRELTLSLEANQYGGAEPYDELLRGLHVEKSQGPVNLSITETHWLSLNGSVENLMTYVGYFYFEKDSGHHHPENLDREGYIDPRSLNLIIEVDTDWVQELKAKRH